MTWLTKIQWNTEGLVPVITQDYQSHAILMQAWMNQEALELTVQEKRAVYWSRSRKKIWYKGEESGNYQIIKEIFLDCDADSLLIKVQQIGGIACHTGRSGCFYRRLEDGQWLITQPVIQDPATIYKNPTK